MSKQSIPRDEWISFFVNFNKAHRDKIVDISVTDDSQKVIDRAAGIAFSGIEVTDRDKENTIAQVVAGDSGSTSNFTHFIDKVNDIVLEKTESNDPKNLMIKSSAGRMATIYFRSMGE